MNIQPIQNIKMKILAASTLLFMKLTFLPSINLLMWMSIAIAADFATGVVKAVLLKTARTSSGYRKTITKFLQYGGAITVSIILGQTAKENNMVQASNILLYLNDGLVIFIIYIEVTSIFENIYECDKESPFSRYFIAPMLKLLTFQLKNNPLNKTLGDATK